MLNTRHLMMHVCSTHVQPSCARMSNTKAPHHARLPNTCSPDLGISSGTSAFHMLTEPQRGKSRARMMNTSAPFFDAGASLALSAIGHQGEKAGRLSCGRAQATTPAQGHRAGKALSAKPILGPDFKPHFGVIHKSQFCWKAASVIWFFLEQELPELPKLARW